MAGSHRAPRGGGRAAAREERRRRARKRNQLIGLVAAGVVLLGGGGIAAVNALSGGAGDRGGKPGSDDRSGQDSAVLTDQQALLHGAAAKPLSPAGAWAVTGTVDGSSAPEKTFVCQSQRFADPAGIRTWVRTFQNVVAKDSAVQYVEVSTNAAAAANAYNTVVGWLGQCNTPQVRLAASWSTTGLGDRGLIAVFALPPGGKVKYRTVAVTVAGQATMVLQHDSAAPAQPEPGGMLTAATAAVKKFCGQTGGCGSAPKLRSSLLPTTEPAGFMSPVDLPVLAKVDKPWVSAQATTRSGTGCERMDLKKAKASKYKTQTYVTPEAEVPTEFGMDATVVKFATPAAATSFVTGVRKNVDGCEKAVSNAEVEGTGEVSAGRIRGESWRASYDTGRGKFTYRIGIAGSGDRAVYLVFPVLKDLDVTDTAFNQTLTRAAERSTSFK